MDDREEEYALKYTQEEEPEKEQVNIAEEDSFSSGSIEYLKDIASEVDKFVRTPEHL